jgi:hypothetical protein
MDKDFGIVCEDQGTRCRVSLSDRITSIPRQISALCCYNASNLQVARV